MQRGVPGDVGPVQTTAQGCIRERRTVANALCTVTVLDSLPGTVASSA